MTRQSGRPVYSNTKVKGGKPAHFQTVRKRLVGKGQVSGFEMEGRTPLNDHQFYENLLLQVNLQDYIAPNWLW